MKHFSKPGDELADINSPKRNYNFILKICLSVATTNVKINSENPLLLRDYQTGAFSGAAVLIISIWE